MLALMLVAAGTGCAESVTTALGREEANARKSGMTCWVERETGDESGVYCGDPALAPVGTPRFVRWVTQP